MGTKVNNDPLVKLKYSRYIEIEAEKWMLMPQFGLLQSKVYI